MNVLLVLAMLFLLSGCGGFRGGIESVPYVGENPPEETDSRSTWFHEINLPGITLSLSLNNKLRTYQYELMLFFIPTYLNFWNEFQDRDAETPELSFYLIAHELDLKLDPWRLVITVDGKEFRPTGVWVNNNERERQVLDAYIKARRQSPGDRPPPIPRSSEWRDAVTIPVMMKPGETSPRFIITFPIPLPSPERALSLDLTGALEAPMISERPVIRFKPTRWSEGYS
ncbi:hypothetical protein [Petrachloros mirabilis]